jgi:hypothetical protein
MGLGAVLGLGAAMFLPLPEQAAGLALWAALVGAAVG